VNELSKTPIQKAAAQTRVKVNQAISKNSGSKGGSGKK
jgi:hypothetical protein